MHAAHELAHLVAALILLVGGGALLWRAAVARRRSIQCRSGVRPATGPDRRAAMGAMRRTGVLVVASLSAAAATIHLASGPDHVAELGDLGLGFYWAAIFQGAFAVAWATRAGSTRLAGLGLLVNIGLIGAWAWARAIGLPGTPGPEPVGLADGTVVALELALVAGLATRLPGIDTRLESTVAPARLATAATSGLVVALGVIALSTTIAVAAAAGGHGADGHHGAASAAEPVPAHDTH